MYDYDWTDEEYRESLKNTPEPILLSQIDTKMDLRGLMTYAKEKGIDCRKSLHTSAFVHLGWAIKLYWCFLTHADWKVDFGIFTHDVTGGAW